MKIWQACIAVAGLALVGACETDSMPTDPADGTLPNPIVAYRLPPPAARTPKLAVPLPERKPSRPTASASENTGVDPASLIGLNQAQTASMLGRPTSQDDRPPARVWSYSGRSCVLSIFFFPDINSRVFQALTFEVKGADATAEAKRRCLAEVIGAHSG